MQTILLLDTVHPDFPEMLKKNGYGVDILHITNEQEFQNVNKAYTGIVLRSTPQITAETIDLFPHLKFIARAGSGVESIDYVYARNKGIEVLHSPEGNCDAVGEHALALTICLLKNIGKSWLEVRARKWKREENRGSELFGKTVGIIGFGNTGSAFARKLSGLEVRVLAYDKYKTGFANTYVHESTLEEIFEQADIVSFHVPLTTETIQYANADFFSRLKKNIILINTSRGKVVNSKNLVDAIQNKKVTAAGLDVLEQEDFNFDTLNESDFATNDFLFTSAQVMITPHIAGITKEAKLRHATVLCKKIQQVLH